MRNLFKLALLATLLVAVTVSPALAKKKAPIDRTVVDGVTLAEVKPGSQIPPYYPATARISKVYAEVIVSLEVLGNGKVGQVNVISASVPEKGFEQSATDAVKNWRFHPALKDGEPIETATLVRLSFSPPTLNAPEGFIFVETSPRNHAIAFMDTFTDRSFMEEFRNSAANHDAGSRIEAYDMPPCPSGAKNDCLYDRNDMMQFNGEAGSGRSPHNTPVSSSRTPASRGGGR
jgi:TonB family protein